MDGSDIEHRSEIRRANRATPLWISAIVVAVLAGLLFGGGDGDGAPNEEPDPPTIASASPTSETLTTTGPPGPPPVYGVGRGFHRDSALVPTWSASAEPTSTSNGPQHLDPFSTPVVTAGRVAVLADDATLFVGSPGEPYAEVECCFDELVPSNEPHHVWGRWINEAALVDLDLGRTRIRIPLDGDLVVGPASFGLVTVGEDGTVRWRRPSFDPLDLPIPPDRRVLDSGGELVLVAATVAPDRVRYELWSITDGAVVRADELTVTPEPSTTRAGTLPPGDGIGGVLAADGSAMALRGAAGWSVRSSAGGTRIHVLPAGVGEPVWIGRQHFAVLTDLGALVTGSEQSLVTGPVFVALAEQSP